MATTQLESDKPTSRREAMYPGAHVAHQHIAVGQPHRADKPSPLRGVGTVVGDNGDRRGRQLPPGRADRRLGAQRKRSAADDTRRETHSNSRAQALPDFVPIHHGCVRLWNTRRILTSGVPLSMPMINGQDECGHGNSGHAPRRYRCTSRWDRVS